MSLPDNFRSHGDILALVDAVFSQDRAFGSEFCILTRAALLTGRRTPSSPISSEFASISSTTRQPPQPLPGYAR